MLEQPLDQGPTATPARARATSFLSRAITIHCFLIFHRKVNHLRRSRQRDLCQSIVLERRALSRASKNHSYLTSVNLKTLYITLHSNLYLYAA